MRLIDADALASALNNGRLKEQTGRAVPFNAGVAFALTMVEYAPTIDAVPVVRCKNCDYWNELEKGVGVCKRLVEAMWVDYTDFCSFAENKDDITYGERENDE